ncbi:MAG: DUF4330 domain-containing protein [Clostridia bacterium]|nr:DUF4330 domain-containing protein [Clostridia bacterium]
MNHKSNGKASRKKINLVDAVIAVVFLMSLAVTIYLTVTLAFSDGDGSSGSGMPVEYSLTVNNIDAERYGITLNEQTGIAECDFLKIGDTLYTDDAKSIGKLVSIRYEVATGSTGKTDNDGSLIYAEYPGRVNLILTVRGELSGDALEIGDLKLRVGKTISFHTSGYNADAKIMSVDTEVE